MNLFKTLQVPEVQRYWIRQARVPICFLSGRPKTAVDPDGATLIDLLVDNERIAAIEPAGVAASADLPAIDLEAHHVWPTLIDMHAHLDKGHIVIRTENPDGSFAAALKSIAEDRSHRWTAKDIQRRVEFGLRCAYIHGVAAIRTHLEDIDPLLDTLLRLASERGLDVDLHVDESGDPAATALAHVAAAVLRNRFRGRVVCGHCCSLAVQPEEQIRRTLDLCAEAGIAIATLPTVNLYLQDRSDGRTPRWRGVAPVHEMRHRGIPVAIAG